MAARPEPEDPLTFAAFAALSAARAVTVVVGPGGAVPIPAPIQVSEIMAWLDLHGILDADVRARMAEAIMAMDAETR